MWSHTSLVLCTSIANFVTQNMFLYASFQKIVNALTETHSRNRLSQIHISSSWLSVIKKLPQYFWTGQNYSASMPVSSIAQSCPTLCNPMDSSLSGSSVNGISQARILEWVAFPSPWDLPNPGVEPESPALQADALPLSHQGSPSTSIDGFIFFI